MSGIIILTSHGFSTETIRNRFESLTPNKSNKKVAIITTAARDNKNNKYVLLDKELFLKMGYQEVNLIDLEETPETDFEEYDVISVAGGNTFKLIAASRIADFGKSILNLLDRGGIYFGISAGSLILASSIDIANEVNPDVNYLNMTDHNGLNIIPITIYPHYEPSIEHELVEFEKRHQVKLYRLTNDQALVINYPSLNFEEI